MVPSRPGLCPGECKAEHEIPSDSRSLPNAPKGIFDALPEAQRDAVNQLVKAFVTDYLNRGRHVEPAGDRAGDFPVNRIDARFALDATRVILSYTSRALAASRQTAS